MVKTARNSPDEVTAQAATYILPFVNTPANIFNFAMERSPIAPFTQRYADAIAAGGAKADLARTKMAIGSMTMALGYEMAMNGVITGSGPSNPAARDLWMRSHQPYSIKIGDQWYAYNRLDPLGYMFGAVGDLFEAIDNSRPEDGIQEDLTEITAITAFSLAENALDKNYLSGLANFMKAATQPDRYATSFVEQFASSFIPYSAALGQAAKITDPVKRHTSNITERFKSRIPGFGTELPARRDLWGREETYSSGLGVMYDTFVPVQSKPVSSEPIDEFMKKEGWSLGKGGGTIQIDGETVSMRNEPEARNRFYQLRGSTRPSEANLENGAWQQIEARYGDKTLLETLNELVAGKSDWSERFNELPSADDRENFIRKIVSHYRKAATSQLLDEYPHLTDIARQKIELKQQRPGAAQPLAPQQ